MRAFKSHYAGFQKSLFVINPFGTRLGSAFGVLKDRSPLISRILIKNNTLAEEIQENIRLRSLHEQNIDETYTSSRSHTRISPNHALTLTRTYPQFEDTTFGRTESRSQTSTQVDSGLVV